MGSDHNKIFKYAAFFCLLLMMACRSTRTTVVLPPNDNNNTTRTMVVLLPDDNNNTKSAVVINQGSTTTILDKPMTAVTVNTSGLIKKENITQKEVENDFSVALAATPPEPISFILYFETGTTVVLDISKDTLVKLFEEVDKRQAVEVQITGHTDTIGTQSDNDRLSTQRAESIKKMLIYRGLKSNFIRAVGRGERELLISTPDNVDETRNRRVEVIVR